MSLQPAGCIGRNGAGTISAYHLVRTLLESRTSPADRYADLASRQEVVVVFRIADGDRVVSRQTQRGEGLAKPGSFTNRLRKHHEAAAVEQQHQRQFELADHGQYPGSQCRVGLYYALAGSEIDPSAAEFLQERREVEDGRSTRNDRLERLVPRHSPLPRHQQTEGLPPPASGPQECGRSRGSLRFRAHAPPRWQSSRPNRVFHHVRSSHRSRVPVPRTSSILLLTPAIPRGSETVAAPGSARPYHVDGHSPGPAVDSRHWLPSRRAHPSMTFLALPCANEPRAA